MTQSPKESSSLRQKAVKGLVWSAIQSWGRQAIALIIFSLLARLLGPEAFGIVASAGIFLAFIDVFLDQGFSTVIIQRHELEPEHLDTAFWTNIGISFLLTVLSMASADLVADFFKQPLAPIIRWLSLSFLVTALSSVQEAILKRNLEFKPLAIRELLATVIGGLVGVIMAFTGFGVWSLVGQQLVYGLVRVLCLWWVSNWRPRFKVSPQHFQEMFSFGINVVGIKIIDFFGRRSDDFLISYFLGPVALGYYSLAYRLLLIMLSLLTGVTSQVMMPSFAKLQLEPEKLRQAFYTVTQLTSLISFPAFIGLAVLAFDLVQVFFGKQWLPSAQVIQILALIGIIESVYFFYTDIMMAVGKPFHRLCLDLLNLIVNVVGFALAVRWGIVAVAAAFVIRGYLLSPFALLLLRKLIHIQITRYVSQFIAPVLGSLVMVLGIIVTKQLFRDLIGLPVLLVVCIVVGAIVYTASMLLIAPTIFKQLLELTRLSALPVKLGIKKS